MTALQSQTDQEPLETMLKKHKLSIMILFAVIVILSVAIVFLIIDIKIIKKQIIKDVAIENNTIKADTNEQLPQGLWELEITENSVKEPGLNNGFFYATVHQDGGVIIQKKNLQDNSVETIAGFYSEADTKVNLAFSPNGEWLAVTDSTGLRAVNLQNFETKYLIKRTNEVVSEMDGQPLYRWQPEISGNVFDLSNPQWTFDSRYISFREQWYEGAVTGLVNLESGEYFDLTYNNQKIGDRLVWSPVKQAYLAAGAGGYNIVGLMMSIESDFKKAYDFSEKFGKKDYGFNFANFSPDGQKIAFITQWGKPNSTDSQPGDSFDLVLVNTDGTGLTTLTTLPYQMDTFGPLNLLTPFFSPDGQTVYTFYLASSVNQATGLDERNFTLGEYNLNSQKYSEVVKLPSGWFVEGNPSWTKDGYLTFKIYYKGNNSASYQPYYDNTSRYFVLDLRKHKIIFLSSALGETNFIGGIIEQK